MSTANKITFGNTAGTAYSIKYLSFYSATQPVSATPLATTFNPPLPPINPNQQLYMAAQLPTTNPMLITETPSTEPKPSIKDTPFLTLIQLSKVQTFRVSIMALFKMYQDLPQSPKSPSEENSSLKLTNPNNMKPFPPTLHPLLLTLPLLQLIKLIKLTKPTNNPPKSQHSHPNPSEKK